MIAPVRIVAPVGGAPLRPEAEARAAIARYLEHFDHRSDGIPKRIDPALVERVLLEVLDAGAPPPGVAQRMVELADLYAARGVVPRWLELLDRGEADEDGAATAGQLVIGVGALGDDAARARGLAHYHRLIVSRYAGEMFRLLLRCFDAYTPGETSGLLVARLEQQIAALRTRVEAEEASGWSASASALDSLEDLRNVHLRRAEEAARMKQDVLAELDPAARLDRLARIYAGFDLRYHELTKRWAARMILRAARAGGQAEAAAALRALEDDPAEDLAEPPEYRQARAVFAVAYLGAELTPEEQTVSNPMLKRTELLSLD